MKIFQVNFHFREGKKYSASKVVVRLPSMSLLKCVEKLSIGTLSKKNERVSCYKHYILYEKKFVLGVILGLWACESE